MLVVHGTKKFLDRAGELDPADERMSTTVLGSWYATHYRYTIDDIDLQDLAAGLAQTPCGPLFKTHVSPDAALRAAVTEHMP